MLRSSLLALLLSAVQAVDAATIKKESFNEVFATYIDRDNSSNRCHYLGCPDDLTKPINGLKWSNILTEYKGGISDLPQPGGLLPPSTTDQDTTYYAGVYEGRATNPNQTVTLTSKYGGSHVTNWKLHGFGAGCSATNFYQDPLSCDIHVEGFDSKGNCVGHESYSYVPVVQQIGGNLKFWKMHVYNTTAASAGGLRARYLQRLEITFVPQDSTKDLTNFEAALYGVSYTVFNRTA